MNHRAGELNDIWNDSVPLSVCRESEEKYKVLAEGADCSASSTLLHSGHSKAPLSARAPPHSLSRKEHLSNIWGESSLILLENLGIISRLGMYRLLSLSK